MNVSTPAQEYTEEHDNRHLHEENLNKGEPTCGEVRQPLQKRRQAIRQARLTPREVEAKVHQ